MSSYRTALVTGASSGMGRGVALELARRGTYVYAAARRKQELDALVDEIARAGGAGEAFPLDVANADATHDAVRALDEKNPLELVIANAGVGDFTPAQKFKWKRAKQLIDVNFTGAVATIAGALPGMIERGTGHIVGIASVAGLRGLPMFSTYSATKAALITFLEGLRLDLHGSHVYVTTICPGFVKTEMTANNKGPMPFAMECKDAVKVILKAIDDKESVRAFPWPLVAAIKSTRLVPDALFVAMNRRSNLGG